MKQRNAPIKKRRIEVWEGHPAEIVVRPAKRVWEDCLIVDLRNRRMARAIPRAREFAPPNRGPHLPGQKNRRCDDRDNNDQEPNWGLT